MSVQQQRKSCSQRVFRWKQRGLTSVDCITLREEYRREEAPASAQPIQPVIEAQVEAQMVDVVAKIKPVLTFKA